MDGTVNKILGGMLAPKFSGLWVMTSTGCGLSYAYIGWWAFVWLFCLALPVTVIEVLWEMRNERS